MSWEYERADRFDEPDDVNGDPIVAGDYVRSTAMLHVAAFSGKVLSVGPGNLITVEHPGGFVRAAAFLWERERLH